MLEKQDRGNGHTDFAHVPGLLHIRGQRDQEAGNLAIVHFALDEARTRETRERERHGQRGKAGGGALAEEEMGVRGMRDKGWIPECHVQSIENFKEKVGNENKEN